MLLSLNVAPYYMYFPPRPPLSRRPPDRPPDPDPALALPVFAPNPPRLPARDPPGPPRPACPPPALPPPRAFPRAPPPPPPPPGEMKQGKHVMVTVLVFLRMIAIQKKTCLYDIFATFVRRKASRFNHHKRESLFKRFQQNPIRIRLIH